MLNGECQLNCHLVDRSVRFGQAGAEGLCAIAHTRSATHSKPLIHSTFR